MKLIKVELPIPLINLRTHTVGTIHMNMSAARRIMNLAVTVSFSLLFLSRDAATRSYANCKDCAVKESVSGAGARTCFSRCHQIC